MKNSLETAKQIAERFNNMDPYTRSHSNKELYDWWCMVDYAEQLEFVRNVSTELLRGYVQFFVEMAD